jgi:hypothetical protein
MTEAIRACNWRLMWALPAGLTPAAAVATGRVPVLPWDGQIRTLTALR